jgi:hypothetical protein
LFKNTRTGASAEELIAYKTEDENTALARFKAAGWSFTGDYYWDEKSKAFIYGKKPDESEDESEQDE